MPSPFPGTDPYLEKPSGWPDVHHELISATRAALKTQIGPTYHVRIEERIYISNDNDPGRIVLVPDVQVSSRDVDARSPTTTAEGGIDVAEPLVLETLIEERTATLTSTGLRFFIPTRHAIPSRHGRSRAHEAPRLEP